MSVYDEDCTPPARVYVIGEEISAVLDDAELEHELPVINEGVTTKVRKDGPCGINRLSEVYFPAHWKGEDFSQIVRALNPSEDGVYDEVRIEIEGEDGEYRTAHHGFVMGAGAGAKGGRERRMRVGGLERFLDVIPANVSFDDPAVRDVLRYVQREFTTSQPVIDQLPIAYSGQDFNVATGSGFVNQILSDTDPISRAVQDALSDVIDPTEFTPNRHTLRDVVEWLTERVNAFYYFDYDDDTNTPVFVYDVDPTFPTLEATHLDGDVTVLDNNALWEISPYNTVTVEGETSTSVTADHSEPRAENPKMVQSETKYPYVRVYHEPLRRRAGMALQPPKQEISATTLERAERAAKRRLKEFVDGEGGGEIVTTPDARLRPYVELKSRPACNENAATDVLPLSYEIENVTHSISATERDSETEYARQTTLDVSMTVLMENIVVEQSTMIEV